MTSTALHYPFDSAPDAGHTKEIDANILWVRHSLPMALDHINVWLLRNEDECVIVDTGINMPKSKEVWRNVLAAEAKSKPVSKIVATHLHPDHCGLAGWLASEHECPLYMTRSEYLLCRTLCFDSAMNAPKEALEFYRAAGLTTPQLDDYARKFGGFGRAISPLPPSYYRLQDEDKLELAGQTWEVIVGNGHSPEHACLFNEATNTLISGDQVLPRISSIIAVWPNEPESDPLEDWLNSCRMLRDRIPHDALILPSHGRPFYGVHQRLTELIDHHESLLEQLVIRCRDPQRSIDVFDILFNSKINDSNLVMAVGESIAHFNYLRRRNLVSRSPDAHGIEWYTSG